MLVMYLHGVLKSWIEEIIDNQYLESLSVVSILVSSGGYEFRGVILVD